MHTLLRALGLSLALMAGLWSQAGQAENCGPATSQMTINLQNIKYLPTLPSDMQMTTPMADNGGGVHFTCDRQAPTATWKRIVYQQNGAPETIINGRHVFPSSIKGIGYALGLQCNGGAIRYIDGADAPAGSESVTLCDSRQTASMLDLRELIVKIDVIFYKTGNVELIDGHHRQMDPLPHIGKLYIEYQPAGAASSVTSPAATLDLAAMNVDIGQQGSCQVTRSTINVDLGTVSRTDFHGKGQTAGNVKTFSLPVYCTARTDIRVGFFGVTAAADMPDTLALTQQADAARGVGVKLRYGQNPAPAPAAGTPVKINEASNLPVVKTITASDAGHAENINFTAEYVQTEERVSAGTANSMATFVLIYN